MRPFGLLRKPQAIAASDGGFGESILAVAAQHARRATYRLSPPGPVGLLGDPPVPRVWRTLIGELAGDRVAVWLVHENRSRTALTLPGEYTAQLDPFELLDEHGCTVARGGEEIAVMGGFLPSDDPRAVGYERGVFCAGRVLGTDAHGSLAL